MKFIITLIFITIANITFGQFALINDKDGYCNLRSSAEMGDNIQKKLYNGQYIYCFVEPQGNWLAIDYKSDNEDDYNSGFIYKDRAKYITDYEKIPIVKSEKNKVVHRKDSINIVFAIQKFDKKKYKLTFDKEKKSSLRFINKKHVWGTDGEIPTNEYQSIEVKIGNKNIALPKSALENLFNISLTHSEINYDRANDILYLVASNSDGAGSYTVLWSIEKGVYKGRFVKWDF